jgi:hypothetical protein
MILHQTNRRTRIRENTPHPGGKILSPLDEVWIGGQILLLGRSQRAKKVNEVNLGG